MALAKLRETHIVTIFLILTGVMLFCYRAFILDFPLTPDRTVQSWHIETKLSFDGTGDAPSIQLYLPRPSERYTIVDENFVSDGFSLSTSGIDDTGNRISQWRKAQSRGREIIYYRAILYEARQATASNNDPPAPSSYPVFGSAAFSALAKDETEYFALKTIISDLRDETDSNDAFITGLFRLISDGDGRITQLRERIEGLETDASLAVFILKHNGMAARVMNGISLQDNARNITPESWTEIRIGDHWLVYDKKKEQLTPRHGRLGWWSGTDRLYHLDGGQAPVMSVSVRKHVESALTESIWQGNPTREAVYRVSVFSLPVDVQLLFAILLLVPVGALVVSIMRQMVGIHTYGTFMPVLVALAFRETQLLWGIILFTTIVALGLACRLYLDRLQLLLIPRLGAILTLVVIAIYILSVTTFHLGVHAGLSISLFPIVILAMLIERMSVTWEEFGGKVALQTALGSLVTAIAGYAVISNNHISHIVTTFPELLLIVLALHVMIGRYNGYKLTELYRFRSFR